MARKPISKKLRFEVFKRDSFACQYCGQASPAVILQCDHVKPVAEGGSNDILNLITSCVDCNAGKGARVLSDHSVLAKQVDQLAALQARREQLEMMIEWRSALAKLDDRVVDRLAAHWTGLCEYVVSLTPSGTDALRRVISKFGVDLTMQAMTEALRTYGRRDESQKLTKESLDVALSMLPRVARVMQASTEKPYLKRLYYIRGILRNRLTYLNEWLVMDLLEQAVLAGADVDSLEDFAKNVRSWTALRNELENFISRQADGEN